ncbi:MAG TPA: hypothetical protein VG722_09220 [Tepidisphaeraceae bacterium]|nr:hypothetical protein [Tepidisphaeraceae bacterium]
MKRLIFLLTILFFAFTAYAAEFLGEPCRSANVLATGLVHAGQQEYFAMVNMNEISHAELILINTKTGKGKSFTAPAGAGCWAMQQVDSHRVVLGTYYDGMFMVFDLNSMKFIKTIHFPGEQYLWNFAMGSDGRLYTGTYPGGKLGALDLTNYKVEDLGNPAKPNLYCRLVSALPDGRIFCFFEEAKDQRFIFNPKSGQFSPAPKDMDNTTDGVVWNNYFLGSQNYDGKSPIAFDRNLKAVDPPPFPLPTGKDMWKVNTKLTDADNLYIEQDNSLYHFRAGQSRLTQVFEADLHSGYVTARASGGTFFGYHGQRYFTIKPGQNEIHLHRFPVQLSPRDIVFLQVDPHGILWGGPTFGQTLFWLDPATKKFVNTDTICNAGGEVYDATFFNNKVYAASYSGGDIVEYDRDQPWDQFDNKNPRTIVHLAKDDCIRPVGGITIGDDHLLYSGWMAEYGEYGGSVAITDPKTGKTDLIKNPLGEEDVSGIAVDDHYIYVGTTTGANGLPPKPNSTVSFGVIDKSTHKVVYSHSFSASSVHSLARDRVTGIVVFAVDNNIQLFDPSKLLAKQNPLLASPNVPGTNKSPTDATASCLAAPGNGHLYFGSGNIVYSLDLRTMQIRSVAVAPVNHIVCLAVSKTGTIYVSDSSKLYQLN